MFKSITQNILSKSFCTIPKNENIFSYLNDRDLICNISNQELLKSDSKLDYLGKHPRVYIGFDPTANSLHLGNLIGILTALRFSAFGIDPVMVIGGATGQIGDPSGKSKERPMLDKDKLEENLEGIRKNLSSVFGSVRGFQDFRNFYLSRNKNEGRVHPAEAIIRNLQMPNNRHVHIKYFIVNNEEFYRDLSMIDFLRQVGVNLRMGPLLSRDTVKNRINSDDGLSLTEFMYQTFQGYDYLKLFEKYSVKIQIGGSDQWGNMLAGYELIKKIKNTEVINMTFPLMTTATGAKFGKSEGNALYINPDLTPINSIYQYFYNSSDTDLQKLFNAFTFIEKEEITDIMNSHIRNPEARIGQKKLSEKVVGLLYGEDEAEKCRRNTQLYYLSTAENLMDILNECQATEIGLDIFTNNTCLSKLVVENRFVNSKAEVRRLIKTGSVTVNNEKIDSDVILNKEMLYGGKYLLIKCGKKKSFVFKLKQEPLTEEYTSKQYAVPS
jgi:tyrosyl-tRNA synthetase